MHDEYELENFLSETKLPYHQGKILEYLFGAQSTQFVTLSALSVVLEEIPLENDFLFLLTQNENYIEFISGCVDKLLGSKIFDSERKEIIRKVATIHIFSGATKKRLGKQIHEYLKKI